tara:strand:+ start:2238 stop:2480 length:243 start_codon:yes stop_codon:yes gene_type:complete
MDIQIEHLACDVCGTPITDDDFVAQKQAWWYEVDGIFCDECNRKKIDRIGKEVIEIQVGMYVKPSQPINVSVNGYEGRLE